MYAINKVSMKYLSKIIKEYEKFPYKDYAWKRPKHVPTDSYFYIAKHLAKCMMRAYAFNSKVEPIITKTTGIQNILISHVCDSEKRGLKGIIADKNLSQVYSTDERK